MFETDYEDFVIDLFSQLPSTIYYYKIPDKLFIHASLDRDITVKVFSSLKDINRLPFFVLIKDLLNKGIVRSEAHAIECFFWRRYENL